ncbi:electron transporter SCO1/SenC [Devosia pacifica]|uniref:Electron transporter SCO1/SenC n=1 Tax=Devosia pacifica TaxID=1335967 RepID=A0A918S6B2_9HYPH|nr:SCO family protein [Devosia pacifica]GHA26249.1 electron transporter SCO1/SenC [Devosia pacifica]
MASSGLAKIRIALWGGVVAVAAIGILAWAMRPEPSAAIERYGAGDYELVTQNGEPVDDSMFVGHPSAVFFGFTHCPDVCPTTLAEMTMWFERLGEEAEDLDAYFITVDPERDTPQVLGDYVGAVSDDVIGVTGDPDEIDKIVDAFSVLAERVPLDGGGYTMNHTASVFLLNSDGEFEGTIAYQENMDTAVGKLRNLIDG